MRNRLYISFLVGEREQEGNKKAVNERLSVDGGVWEQGYIPTRQMSSVGLVFLIARLEDISL